ncbi:MAG: hypothetical protein GTO03_10720 [Planctomycetales bacterium]|nr:hypothetical protein [Planctomycetales bacterium]
MTTATLFAATFFAAPRLAAAGALDAAALLRFATAGRGCFTATICGDTTVAIAGEPEVGSFGFSVARGNDQAGYQQHGKQRVQFHIDHSLLD